MSSFNNFNIINNNDYNIIRKNQTRKNNHHSFNTNEDLLKKDLKNLKEKYDALSGYEDYYSTIFLTLEYINTDLNTISEKTMHNPYKLRILENAFNIFTKSTSTALKAAKTYGTNLENMNKYEIFRHALNNVGPHIYEPELVKNNFDLDQLNDIYNDLLYRFKNADQFVEQVNGIRKITDAKNIRRPGNSTLFNSWKSKENAFKLKTLNEIKEFFSIIKENIENEEDRYIEELDNIRTEAKKRISYMKSNEYKQYQNVLYNYFKPYKNMGKLVENDWELPTHMNMNRVGIRRSLKPTNIPVHKRTIRKQRRRNQRA